MYFQVAISPTKKPVKKAGLENGEEHVDILSLAPFTANPKLSFEDVPVGTTAQRKICIRNPTKCDVQLTLIKVPCEERQLTFNWLSNHIASGSDELLIISWTPSAAGSWREILHLGDGGRIRREISIVFKSVETQATKRKSIRVQLGRNSLPIQRKSKKSPPKKCISPQAHDSTLQEFNRSASMVYIDPPCRRDTYLVSNKENSFFALKPTPKNLCKIVEEVYEDSLENISAKDAIPYTPLMKDRTKVINYTPLLASKPEIIVSAAPETPKCSRTFNCSTGRKLLKAELSAESANFSGEANLHTTQETYIVNTCAGATFSKDPSAGNLSSLRWSPFLQSNHQTFTDINISPINVTPLMGSNNRQKISPIKRLSAAYTKKPQFLTPSAIRPTNTISPKKVMLVLKQHDVSYNEVCNPYMLASTSGIDPFQSQTQYYDPHWVTEQIRCFKNWLNVLLLPPASLNCQDKVKIDVARLWQECHNKEVSKAPSKETASNQHNTNHLLQSLRRNACALYATHEMTVILSKCSGLAKNDKFAIRQDKNVHQDIGLQKEILGLLLCFNPLWLRIGLETVYNVQINLRSNSDVCRLTRFLMDHFFNEPGLLKKYKGKFSPKYVVEIKRHVTIKFLSLLYFLDRAKQERLVQYDPCLFSRHAEVKDSNELLLRFVGALFSSIRDVVKPLKYVGYVVTHKQSLIHEYEYGIDDLGTDLKDGVRLVRVMEIILLQRNLVDLVRLPAISRLQKIHNVKLAFDALQKADFLIDPNIEPKDIVNGHKEKTLSFLWQIIYKFQSPRIMKATLTLQRWFRSPQIQRKLKLLAAGRNRKRAAAVKIAKWYKAMKRRRLAEQIEAIVPIIRSIIEEKRQRRAAIMIQKTVRMYHCRMRYLELYHSTLVIQRALRRCLAMRRCRLRFLDLVEASRTMQRRWRAQIAMRRCREVFLRVKNATCCVQNWLRATREMRKLREEYISLQNAAVIVQRYYRAKVIGRIARVRFCKLKNAVLAIENRYIAQKRMETDRKHYIQILSAVSVLQVRLRATLQMRLQRKVYLRLKNAAILVQTTYRAQIESKRECKHLNHLPMCTSILRRRLQDSIIVKKQQNYLHSVDVLQTWYRCTLLAIFQNQLDVEVRVKYSIFIQRRFRALVLMKKQRSEFLLTKRCTVNVQRRFRAQIAMKIQRRHYLHLKNAVVMLQHRWKAFILTKQDRGRFVQLKQATIKLQQFWRGAKATQTESKARHIKLKAIYLLQTYCRGFLARQKFAELNTPEMIEQRRVERIRKKAVRKIQAMWRGYKSRSLDSDAIVKIRQRLHVATINAEPMQTIFSRTKRTEEALKTSDMFIVIKCFEDLDVPTRLCLKSCVSISKYARMIFNLITFTNRSITHLNACAAGASVLLNIARCEITSNAVCDCFDCDIFLKIMSHHCDKEHVVILKFATLLWVLGHKTICREKIIATPNFQHRMLKMLQLCERQQKMIAKIAANRGKNASLFGKYSNLPLPGINADWGLNYEHSPHTFSNAVHAIHSLCVLFNVKC